MTDLARPDRRSTAFRDEDVDCDHLLATPPDSTPSTKTVHADARQLPQRAADALNAGADQRATALAVLALVAEVRSTRHVLKALRRDLPVLADHLGLPARKPDP